jgi:hypothetical protein
MNDEAGAPLGVGSKVVSGDRLESMYQVTVESTDGGEVPPADRSQLALLVGEENVDEALAPDPDAPAEAEALDPVAEAQARAGIAHFQFAQAIERLKREQGAPGVFATDEDQALAVIQSALVARAAEDPAKLAPAPDGREAKFDERDVRWALSLLTWIGKLRPHAWVPPPVATTPMGPEMRMALLGDWGTGLYGAPGCSRAIKAEGGFHAVVHLGDVYYSGTPGEVRSNFLEHWPTVPGARYFACNGNHEMYSGGYGYFKGILPAFAQPSSCFAMENDHWLVVGLDSAYRDHDLAKGQEAWLDGLLGRAGSKKLVLFTHHQPFSHFDGGGEKLVARLKPLLDARRITAWYWGHEHRCVVYDAHPAWGFHGRCAGHSGYPYFRKPSLGFNELIDPPMAGHGFWRELPANPQRGAPRAILLDGPNPDLGSSKDDYGPNGYVVLEFDGPSLIERYHLSDGTRLHSITIA